MLALVLLELDVYSRIWLVVAGLAPESGAYGRDRAAIDDERASWRWPGAADSVVSFPDADVSGTGLTLA